MTTPPYLWLKNLGKTKICEFDVEVLIQQDVLWLNIPMDNPPIVTVFQSFKNLSKYPRGFLLTKHDDGVQVLEKLAVDR